MHADLTFRLILFIKTSLLFTCIGFGQLDSLEERITYYSENRETEKLLKTKVELARQLIYFEGKIDEGVEILYDVLPLSDRPELKSLRAKVYHNLGYTYINYLSNLENGLKNYFSALELYDNNKDVENLETLLLNMADVYYTFSSYDQSIKFLFQGLNLAKENDHKEMIATFQLNLGANYSGLNDRPSAIAYLSKASVYYKAMNDEYNYYLTQVNIARLQEYGELSKDAQEKMLLTFNSAIVIFKEVGDVESQMTLLKNLAAVYNYKGQHHKALEVLQELLLIEKEYPNLKLRAETFKEISISYKYLGRFEKHAEFIDKYIELNDTMFSRAKAKAITETRIQYESEKIENENTLLKQSQEIQDAKLEKERLIKYGLGIGLGLIVVFAILIYNRFLVSQKQRKIIGAQKEEVDLAYLNLEVKNKEVMDSISYAKRIQATILPSDDMVRKYLPNSFVYYRPKDIVAGDFYWLEPIHDIGMNNKESNEFGVLFAVADCTGHGVPGAMVSVICNNGLNRSVREHGLTDPGDILEKTRDIVSSEFSKSNEQVNDGMDIALVNLEKSKLNKDEFELSYSGANNPLWIIRNGEIAVEEIKADKQPIGGFLHSFPFTTKKVQLKKGDTIYVFSDGFADQFGGVSERKSGKKLKSTNFKNLLISMQEMDMEEQKENLDRFFNSWKGDLEQLDDVCVMGVRF